MPNKRIAQIRTDALVAKFVYMRRLNKANLVKIIVTALTIITPILFIATQSLTKNSAAESATNIAAFIGSVLLLCLAIYTLIINLDSKIQEYVIGKKNNIDVASEASKLINESDEEKLSWFYKYIAQMDSIDTGSLSDAKNEEKQDAYREALKQLYPGDNSVICPICGASPFRYKPGNCQTCGNTPISIERKD